jgi:GT2 family glycosyltransferase
MPETSEPRVFTILVNWNGRDVTLECLASLAHIRYRTNSIVVVDNASTDGSVDAIRRHHPDVTVLAMKENHRFAGGNNAGMRHALEHGADMILLLNNDTTVADDFLTHMVGRMQSHPAIGMVAPKIYYHDDPARIWFAGGVVSMWTGTMRHTGIRERDNGQHDTAGEIDYASGCCILVRRSVVERVGMLDESFYMYTEDADWSMRVRRAGHTIIYEPKARIWHKLSVSAGGHLSWYKMKNKLISNLRFFGRYAAWYHWLVFPWMNVVVNVLAAIRYIVQTRKA